MLGRGSTTVLLTDQLTQQRALEMIFSCKLAANNLSCPFVNSFFFLKISKRDSQDLYIMCWNKGYDNLNFCSERMLALDAICISSASSTVFATSLVNLKFKHPMDRIPYSHTFQYSDILANRHHTVLQQEQDHFIKFSSGQDYGFLESMKFLARKTVWKPTLVEDSSLANQVYNRK